MVVGLAQTGISVANFCTKRGAIVTVTDSRAPDKLVGAIAQLEGSPTLELGHHVMHSFTTADYVVMSPGVPQLKEMMAAKDAGVPVIAEIEFAYRFLHSGVNLIAITGTNGKSTTTALIGSLCEATGLPTFCGGNLGNHPMIEAVDHRANTEGGFIVVEVAGFMLEHCTSFKPRVSACLNITEDHLDRFGTIEHYAAIKNRIYTWQDSDDISIVNANDSLVVDGAQSSKGQTLRFDSKSPVERGAFLSEDRKHIVLQIGGDNELYPIDDLPIIGNHNLENAMAAYLAARSVGITRDQIRHGAHRFSPQKHRMERVGEHQGVTFFDDSKGTNVAAVAASLFGFPYSVVLIAGGVDKGGSYEPMFKAFDPIARGLVLIGEATQIIRDAADSFGADYPILNATDMNDALVKARSLAKPGDAIVLSPACSSYDMFKNFGERGMAFRDAIQSSDPESH